LSDVIIACRDDIKAKAMATSLEGRGHTPRRVESGQRCLALLDEAGAEVVIVVLPLGDVAPSELLQQLHATDDHLHVIVSGREDSVMGPYDAFEHGAMEYLDAPETDVEALLTAVGVATGSRRGDLHLRYLQERSAAEVHGPLVADCGPMREVNRIVRQLCLRTGATAAPGVLITGETGTGKGMLARFVHDRGGRRNGPFVEVNCAAIPSALLESELFGHERGAFTDAKSQRLGLFETAHRGSLFLDEIGSAPLAVQAKLLKAIEEKRVRRVGGSQDVDVDVQVIAATHHNLRREVQARRFREDLYHRLNVVGIKLPPLRDRGPDKVLLAEQFIRRLCRSYGIPLRHLTPGARRFIEQYTWPGNVRELRNQMERILLLQDETAIDVTHFNVGHSNAPPASQTPPSSIVPSSVVPSSIPEPSSSTLPLKSSGFVLRVPEEGMALDEIEKRVIAHALERFEGNVSRAARHLRITRQTLIYRMRKHELAVERKVTANKG